MELKLSLHDLLRLVMHLPVHERAQLRSLLSQMDVPPSATADMEELLLSGPTFSEAQLGKVCKAREALSEWRRNLARTDLEREEGLKVI